MRPTLTHIALATRDVEASVAFYRSYCGMDIVHDRKTSEGQRVVWISEPGHEDDFIIVLLPAREVTSPADGDYSHLGFAMPNREDVNQIAARAEKDGVLIWPPRDDGHPAGYYCGVRDPDGRAIEFSFGQPIKLDQRSQQSHGEDRPNPSPPPGA